MKKDKNLLSELRTYMIIVGSFLIFMTFFVNLTGHSAIGFTGLWYELDMRIEGSLATWLESSLIFLCVIPCYLIFRSTEKPKVVRGFFLLMVFAVIFLSADEMLSIHEYMGQKILEISGIGNGTFLEGFTWVLIYAPAGLVGLVLFLITTRKLFLTADKRVRRRLILDLFIMFISVAGVLSLEVFEAYVYSLDSNALIGPSFEESFEILVILGFLDFSLTTYGMDNVTS